MGFSNRSGTVPIGATSLDDETRTRHLWWRPIITINNNKYPYFIDFSGPFGQDPMVAGAYSAVIIMVIKSSLQCHHQY
jgi:hypothetical protein